jgi:hypothetical protein
MNGCAVPSSAAHGSQEPSASHWPPPSGHGCGRCSPDQPPTPLPWGSRNPFPCSHILVGDSLPSVRRLDDHGFSEQARQASYSWRFAPSATTDIDIVAFHQQAALRVVLATIGEIGICSFSP